MITKDQYNQLVEKIVACCPEKGWNANKRPPSFLPDNRTSTEFKYKSPELADVMRALSKKNPPNITMDISGDEYDQGRADYEREALGLLRKWDLAKPLDQQSDETKMFLYNLIVK